MLDEKKIIDMYNQALRDFDGPEWTPQRAHTLAEEYVVFQVEATVCRLLDNVFAKERLGK